MEQVVTENIWISVLLRDSVEHISELSHQEDVEPRVFIEQYQFLIPQQCQPLRISACDWKP